MFVVAVRGNIALGFVYPNADNGSGIWLIAAIALVAGVSERFVPSILQKVETTLLDNDARDAAQRPDANPKKTASA